MKQPKVTGTRSAGKALELLRLVARHHPQGVRLTDAIALSGLDRSTVHRQLACLIDEGFVDRATDSKRYRLGIEAMLLGVAPSATAPLVQRFRPLMEDLARQSGDTVFLMVRSGDHALCLHREEARQPEDALIVTPGIRRVLGESAVGVGVLARWADADIATTYSRREAEYRSAGISLPWLRDCVEETRSLGYSLASDHRTGEARGVGCAVRLSETAFAGVSLAARNARMPHRRQRELGGTLVEALQTFEFRGAAV
ncbi:IclR family transcriptional regulator [Hydrogenophaga sp.]|uniref:IclR family transcriptional regulator n=1 Tax=Hydrogenophaga sp. TaxID=1904254 RepID=UPI0027165775|nr:IclR family transcriptional regulator [Hydrogenophaga sp.]MDO9434620.1 IclR family transcriptional regulator [Hydrogenophaga sp.]